MNIKNGKYQGISGFEKGSDISYYMTSWRIFEYPTKKETIIKALWFFKQTYNYFGLYEEIVEDLNETILGEAYVNAAKRQTGDVTSFLIPPNYICYEELKKLVNRYIKNGWVISQEWLDAINEL